MSCWILSACSCLTIPCTMALVVNVALKKTEWTLCISINLNLSDWISNNRKFIGIRSRSGRRSHCHHTDNRIRWGVLLSLFSWIRLSHKTDVLCPYSWGCREWFASSFFNMRNNSPLSILSSRDMSFAFRFGCKYTSWILPLSGIHHTRPHPMPHQHPFFYKPIQIDNRLLITTSCQPCILGAIDAGILLQILIQQLPALLHAQRLIGRRSRRRCRLRTTLQLHLTFQILILLSDKPF